MKHVKLFEQYLTERIKASEAYHTMEGVQTVIDGKRELAKLDQVLDSGQYENDTDEVDDRYKIADEVDPQV